MPDLWERRLRRAEELARLWPHAAEILRLFRAVTAFQAEIAGEPPGLDAAVARIPRLLDVFERHGPADLAALARGAREQSPEEWMRVLKLVFAAREHGNAFEALCLRCLVQPWCATDLAGMKEGVALDDPGLCPFCAGRPAVGILRDDREAEALRRTLSCWRCAREWEFPRVLCPACKEERPERLPRLTAEEIPWIRVEACDSCGKYLKTVDLSKEPAAEPVADELASTPLDLLARERGYGKIAPNLAGL